MTLDTYIRSLALSAGIACSKLVSAELSDVNYAFNHAIQLADSYAPQRHLKNNVSSWTFYLGHASRSQPYETLLP